MTDRLVSTRIATPIGAVRIDARGDELVAITIKPAEPDAAESDSRLLREAAAQLDAYFAGKLEHFDLPLAPAATQRGQTLREAMVAIGYGDTRSYGALARIAGSSPRAIGQACARNPFPIVVPCHRVTASGGALGHYSGGDGSTTKAWLLSHEARDRLL